MCFVQALERIAGLLEGAAGSITLNERGDAAAIHRHPNFRLMAAMNPATDVGTARAQQTAGQAWSIQQQLLTALKAS